MVKAKYTVNYDTHKLVVQGHANYAKYGKDIVCAGVSALVQALMGWCEENYDKVNSMSVEKESGEVLVSCTGGEDVAAVFYMTAIGLEQIADSYPGHVQIDIIGLAD